jgi:hypothetical protein
MLKSEASSQKSGLFSGARVGFISEIQRQRLSPGGGLSNASDRLPWANSAGDFYFRPSEDKDQYS